MENSANVNDISISPMYFMGRFFWNILRWFFLISIAFIILYPLMYMLSMSFRSASDFFDVTVVWIPKSFTLGNFRRVIFEMDLYEPMTHTFLLSSLCTALQLFVTSLAGYSFARYRFRGSNLLFAFVLVTIMMPQQMVSIPVYILMKNLDFFGVIHAITGSPSPVNLLNSYWSFLLPAALGQGLRAGLFILIFRQFYRGLPTELEEAAMIDGCGHARTYFSIMLPNARTPLIICGTFSFVWYWGDYFTPYVFFVTIRTLAVQLMDFHFILDKYLPLAQHNFYYKIPLKQAACIFSILPLIALFIVTQRFFTKGIDKTGIVG